MQQRWLHDLYGIRGRCPVTKLPKLGLTLMLCEYCQCVALPLATFQSDVAWTEARFIPPTPLRVAPDVAVSSDVDILPEGMRDGVQRFPHMPSYIPASQKAFGMIPRGVMQRSPDS